MRGYFDAGRWWHPDWLPVSPVCCLTETRLLRSWTEEVRGFAEKNPFRHEYLIRRSAGPDLMIYFLSLLHNGGRCLLIRCPLAQFSFHSHSISASSGEDELALGYWLARVWLVGELARKNHPEATAWAAWTCHRGLLLLRDRWKRGQFKHAGSLLREIVKLQQIFQGQKRGKWWGNFFRRFIPRAWRDPATIQARSLPMPP